MIIVELTRNQNRVYKWLLAKTNFRKEIVCSARKLALAMNFSDQYAMKILDQLEDHQAITLLRRGVGQRANKYRIEKVRIIAPPERKVKVPALPEEDRPDEVQGAQYTLPGRYNPVSRLSSISRAKKEPPTPYKGGLAFGPDSLSSRGRVRVGETRLRALSNLPQFTVAPKRVMQSPFNRFEKKKHDPETWNAQDIVCYYALLYKYVYGTLPSVNWRRDCGAARNLLNRFQGHPDQVKLHLQVAFGMIRRDWTFSTGLAYFTYDGVIDMTNQRRTMRPGLAEAAVTEYDDRAVLSS